MRTTARWAVALAVVMLAAACTSGGTPSRAPGPTAGAAETAAGASTSAPAGPTTADTTAATAGTGAAGADDLPVLADLSAPDLSPATQTDQLASVLAGSGTPTLGQAIDMFNLSVADLPGATASSMPAGIGFSATTTMAAIQTHRGELTPQQLAVVDSFDGTVIASTTQPGGPLVPVASAPSTAAPTTGTTASTDGPGDSTTPTTQSIAPTSAHTAGWVVPTGGAARAQPVARAVRWQAPPTQSAAFVHDSDLLNQTLFDWNAHEPGLIQLPKGFALAVSSKEPKDNAEMDTRQSTTIPGGCVITMYPVFTGGHYTDALAKFIFAHELFHCIQFTWSSNLGGAEWLVEGSAEFAALDLYRRTFQPTTAEAFEGWFTNTGTALGSESPGRGYDDWPLFESFKQTYATDPYPYIEQMIKAGGSTQNILTAGHFDNPVFASLWTSTSLRSKEFGDAAFQLNWPGVDPTFGRRDTAVDLGSRGVGTYQVKGKGNFIHQQYQVELPGVGIVAVTPNGGPMLTHATAGTVSVGVGQQKWFCTDPGGCVCPAGTEPTVDLTPLTPPMIFSFATQQAASSAAVVARKWDPAKYCVQRRISPGPAGTSNGDPHITTFNGLTYDFMTYGEFVTAQDPQGGFTVQERHARAGFGTAVSAVAVGDGTHRITLTAASITFAAPITVRVDGTVTSSTTFTTGDLSVAPGTSPEDWVISFPDGSAVEAAWDDGFFVTVQPSAARAPRIVGLLGTPGTTFLNDLAMPNGARAVPADDYRAFAQAWWVTDSTSLFDYAAGQNTETFRVVPAPVPPTPPTPATVAYCQGTLGTAATTVEVADCSFDLTSLNPSPPDQTSIAAAYHRTVTTRAADITTTPTAPPAPMIVVGQTGSPAESSAPASAAATSGGAAAVGPTLTLQGTFGKRTDGSVTDTLKGTMTLTAGTVLLAKVRCPSDPAFQLSIKATDAQGDGTSTGLCGDLWRDETANGGPNAESHEGESYLLINKTGTYTVAADDESVYERTSGPLTVSISLASDPTPTVIAATALPAAGTTVQFKNPADTMVVEAAPGSQGGTWSITNGDKVCAQVFYIAGPLDGSDKSPADLGALCWHHVELSIGPASSTLPIVIFDRDGSPVSVTVTRTK